MISSYKICDWLTLKQNYYIRRCDFIRTMVINTMFGFLYMYQLSDIEETELIKAIEDCTQTIEQYEAYENAEFIRKIVKDILDKLFE